MKHFLDLRVSATVMAVAMIKRNLLIALVMSLAAVSVSAQKIIGSGWDGVVVSANETTREITLNNIRGETGGREAVSQLGRAVEQGRREEVRDDRALG